MNKKEMRKFYKLDPLIAEAIDIIQEEQNKILSKLPIEVRKAFREMEVKRQNLLCYGNENGIE